VNLKSRRARAIALFGFLVCIFCFNVIKGLYRFPAPIEAIVGLFVFEFAAVTGLTSVYYTMVNFFFDLPPFGKFATKYRDELGIFFLAFLTFFAALDILWTLMMGVGVPLP